MEALYSLCHSVPCIMHNFKRGIRVGDSPVPRSFTSHLFNEVRTSSAWKGSRTATLKSQRKPEIFAGDKEESKTEPEKSQSNAQERDLTSIQEPRMVSLTIHGISEEDQKGWLEEQLLSLPGVLSASAYDFKPGGLRGGSFLCSLSLHPAESLQQLVEWVHEIEVEGGEGAGAEGEGGSGSLVALPYEVRSWEWRGHSISYAVAGDETGQPLIVVHGFGSSAGHFRHLVALLSDYHHHHHHDRQQQQQQQQLHSSHSTVAAPGYRVFAPDLLGFGESDKPLDADYGPELWAELINDFAAEFTDQPPVLIGNSIGSLTSLAAAVAAERGGAEEGRESGSEAGRSAQGYRGLVLLNCAGAMNRKGLQEDYPIIKAMAPIFLVTEFLLQQPKLASFLFNRFRSKENVRKILEEQAYRDRGAVCDRLVDILYHPSSHPGALEVFVKVFTGKPGPHPRSLLPLLPHIPMLVLWGEEDPWTPADGKVAQLFAQLQEEGGNVSLIPLPDVGHCPHDDRPELAVGHILPWLLSLQQ